MKTKISNQTISIILATILFIISCKNNVDYVEIAENEIVENIHNTFSDEKGKYWDYINEMFEIYLDYNGYSDDSNEPYEPIIKYLENYHNIDSLNIPDSIEEPLLVIREKLLKLGLYQEKNINHLDYKFIYNLYNPTVIKYRKELEKIIPYKPVAIYYIGTNNPDSIKISKALIVDGLIKNYNNESILRPAIKNAIILNFFCDNLYGLNQNFENDTIINYESGEITEIEDTKNDNAW